MAEQLNEDQWLISLKRNEELSHQQEESGELWRICMILKKAHWQRNSVL